MRRPFIIVSLLLLLVPFFASAAVTSPVAGASWCKGTEYTIAWGPADFPAGRVQLVLRLNGTRVLIIKNFTDNSGSFKWIPPADLAESSQYQVRVRAEEGTEFRDSGFFTIKNCGASTPGGTVVLPPPSTPGQPVNSPPAGLTTAQPLPRDFALDTLSWKAGDSLYGYLRNTQSVPFSGTLFFRVKALGHDEKLPIQVSLPASGSVRIDLVFAILEHELFDAGGSDTVEVTVNPERLVPETNYNNNTARLSVATDARIWVEESRLSVTPATYCGSAYPLMTTSNLRVRSRGTGRLTIKWKLPNGSIGTHTLDVSSPSHYTTYNLTENMNILDDLMRHGAAPNGIRKECFFHMPPDENPGVKGQTKSNVVVTHYTLCQ